MVIRYRGVVASLVVVALLYFSAVAATASAHGLSNAQQGRLAPSSTSYVIVRTLAQTSAGRIVETVRFDPAVKSYLVCCGGGGGGCATATAGIDEYNNLGQRATDFQLHQYWCWDGNNITVLPQPTKSAQGWWGSQVTSISGSSYLATSSHGYSSGEATFVLGIPTPWGTVGSSVTNSCQINTFGDGEWDNNCW